MSDPYRDSGGSDPVNAPSDRGIVGDVIAQFADPHAFFRELVQNSIDAGSPDIGVELSYDGPAQKLRVIVRDKGGGMSREVIENQLLVLFRSTKEQDRTKIGKFGVGFASVLSPNPEVVIVNSARDGKRLTLHLYRDLTYELFDGGRATQTGTSIELEIAVPRDEIKAFEDASEAALRRWCRHASVPIELTIERDGARRSLRIDQPLSLPDSLIQVCVVRDDGELTIVAAVGASGGPYLGFFNHGLMLYETTSQAVGTVAVKVQDSRLGHTISRDDVRRDDHYRRALDAVHKVIANELAAAATTQLRALAEAGKHDEWGTLTTALITAEIKIADWAIPLVEPLGATRTISKLERRAWASRRRTPLTEMLGAMNHAVVHAPTWNLMEAVAQRLASVIVDVHHEVTVVTPIEHEGTDVELRGELIELLDRAYRTPAEVLFATLVGAREDLLCVALPQPSTRLLDRDDAVKSPFAFLGRRTLALSAAHPLVKAARKSDNPKLAASHLVRAVLLQYGVLDGDRSRSIVDEALDRIGVRK